MSKHEAEHPLAGYNAKLRDGQRFHIVDWWDRVQGISWRDSGQQIAIDYTARRQGGDIPDNDNVVYGWYETGEESLINVMEIEDAEPGA